MRKIVTAVICTALLLAFAGCAQTAATRPDGEKSSVLPALVKELERIQAERAAAAAVPDSTATGAQQTPPAAGPAYQPAPLQVAPVQVKPVTVAPLKVVPLETPQTVTDTEKASTPVNTQIQPVRTKIQKVDARMVQPVNPQLQPVREVQQAP